MVKNNNSLYSSLSEILNKDTLRRMAGSKYFSRGNDYFQAGYVKNLVELDDRITAKVHGTQKYDVSLWPENGALEYSCSCPLGDVGEFCKHCVATGLKWLDQQKQGGGKVKKSQKPKITAKDVENFLLSQDKQYLIDTILDQARYDGQLMHKLVVKTSRASAKGLDLDAYRSAIDFATDMDFFSDYFSMSEYSRGILDVISSIEDLFNEGYGNEVIELTEYFLSAVERAMNEVDDSDGDLSYILDNLQELHFNACKIAKPDPEELARRLFAKEVNSRGGVFYGAVETYADILDEKGLAVYRELATAEWEKFPKLGPKEKNSEAYGKRHRITKIMEALAEKSNDVEELVNIKKHNLSLPNKTFNKVSAYTNIFARAVFEMSIKKIIVLSPHFDFYQELENNKSGHILYGGSVRFLVYNFEDTNEGRKNEISILCSAEQGDAPPDFKEKSVLTIGLGIKF